MRKTRARPARHRRENRNTVEDHLVAANNALKHVRDRRRRTGENRSSGRCQPAAGTVPTTVEQPPDASANRAAGANRSAAGVATGPAVAVPTTPGSSISSRASERPCCLNTRLVTIVLFNATVMFAVGTAAPAAGACRRCK